MCLFAPDLLSPATFFVNDGVDASMHEDRGRGLPLRPQRKRRAAKQHTSEVQMKRVTGIGGIFFKAKDAPALQAWYKRHLAIDVQDWGGTAFTWADSDGKPTGGTTV